MEEGKVYACARESAALRPLRASDELAVVWQQATPRTCCLLHGARVQVCQARSLEYLCVVELRPASRRARLPTARPQGGNDLLRAHQFVVAVCRV